MSSRDARNVQRTPEALASAEAWLDPFDWYREMRAESPVRYDPDRSSWDVFRYDDVTHVLENDDGLFSTDPRTGTHFREPDEDARRPFLETMLLTDPPRHDELRSVVEDYFRPRAIREREPRIRELTTALLDDALAGDPERVDVVEALAYPLPVIVIAELLGVPPSDRARFKEWSDVLVESATVGEDAGEFLERQRTARRELVGYFSELIAERRANPRDDLLTHLVTAESEAGSTLSAREVMGMCLLLLVAGNITTTNLVANAVRCFGDDDLFETVADDDALPTAVEEVLRHRSPVQAVTRFATEDVTLGGESIDAGDRIVAWIGSANRDEERFPHADAFVPDRTPNQHVAFGHGLHYCLGAPLARVEARVALGELLARLEGIELVETDLRPTRSSFIYGVESLPIRFETETET